MSAGQVTDAHPLICSTGIQLHVLHLHNQTLRQLLQGGDQRLAAGQRNQPGLRGPTFKLHVDLPVEVLQMATEFVVVTGFKLLLGTQRTQLSAC